MSPNTLLTLHDPETTARMLGIKKQQLAVLRLRGAGPRFLRVGRLVRYDIADVLEYIESQKRLRTSDATLLRRTRTV
jgi:hypothetical protein